MTGWRQLVYTSADFDDGTRGGWGVKLASPESFRVSTDTVLMTVDTRLFAAEDVGDFPTAEVLERRHRQLTTRHEGTGRLLVHAIAAGADATGRPGNVFVHAAQADLTGVTAIEFWRSSDWLTPFGPAAVSGSRLPAQISIGSALSRRSIATFLAEPGHLGLLAVLTERLHAARVDGGTVVLLVASPDEAAQWIAALTFVRDARSDDELGWTTWSRAESLTTMREAKVHVVAVPRAEEVAAHAWIAASRDASIVIDTRWAVHRDGDVWKRSDGTTVAGFGVDSSLLTSVQVAVDAFGADLLADLLADAHALTLESSPDYQNPLWALSAATLTDPDVEVADRGDQTRSLIARGPREQRPSLIGTAVDDWWRADPDNVAGLLLRSGAFDAGDLLVHRRVVLLLAGELTWNDDIDCRLQLETAAPIAAELANAVERVEGLLEHRTLLPEAATILRVFEGYGVAVTPTELDALRERLVDGVEDPERKELLDRTWPPMQPGMTSPSVQPLPETARVDDPPGFIDWSEAQVSAETEVSDKPGASSYPLPPDSPSFALVADSWSTTSTSDAPATSPWEATQPVAVPANGPTNVADDVAGLVNRWVMCMLRKQSMERQDVSSLPVAIDAERVRPSDVARVLMDHELQTVIGVVKEAATAAELKLGARPPFDVVASSRVTDGFAYQLVVETFRLVHAGTDPFAWTPHVRTHTLLRQAWLSTGGKL